MHRALCIRIAIVLHRLPAVFPAGSGHNNRAHRYLAVNLFPLGDVLNAEPIVCLRTYFFANIDHHQRCNQALRGNLVDRPGTSHKMRRSIDVSAEMLRQTNLTGEILVLINRSDGFRLIWRCCCWRLIGWDGSANGVGQIENAREFGFSSVWMTLRKKVAEPARERIRR